MSRRLRVSTNLIALLILASCFVLIGLDRAITQTAQPSFLRPITLTLYEWAILLSAFGLLAGGLNIVWTHFRRIQLGGTDWILSLILLIVMTIVLTAGLLDRLGTVGSMVEWIFDSVIDPLQATLFALLGLFLATAAYRYLRIGRPGGGWMIAGALAMILIQMPIGQSVLTFFSTADLLVPTGEISANSSSSGLLEQSLHWLIEWPVMGAMRGAILGSSIALLVVAIRFLLRYR